MRHYIERTIVEELENTVLLGLKSQPQCLIATARLETCLRGLGDGMRDEWLARFCSAEGLSSEKVERGILFRKTLS